MQARTNWQNTSFIYLHRLFSVRALFGGVFFLCTSLLFTHFQFVLLLFISSLSFFISESESTMINGIWAFVNCACSNNDRKERTKDRQGEKTNVDWWQLTSYALQNSKTNQDLHRNFTLFGTTTILLANTTFKHDKCLSRPKKKPATTTNKKI